ncbi:MAG: uracil-DNA glycosylase, partial [Immundisolibacteraceae bacterium]|nr:uracil-DNA glycosylase [Immundisolibacteraceae bacterium]
DWFILGSTPTSEDEQTGDPFSGRSGQLLANMLLALGLSVEQVYLANIVKCRPDQGRAPTGLEAEACKVHLQHQIGLVQPKIILAMGRLAANYLLSNDEPLSEMRGQDFEFGTNHIPVVVTYHPEQLQGFEQKADAWDDLQFACRRYNRQPLSE